MKIGILSDAHGNSLGLQLCLSFLREQGCSSLYFLGDMVGYLPEVGSCFELLKKYEVVCLNGNHDAMVLNLLPRKPDKEAIYLHEYAEQHLSSEALDELSHRKSLLSISIGGRKILLVHGSPWDPLSEYVYCDSDLDRFDDLEFDAVFMGHTHRPFVSSSKKKMLVANVGSCGLPRDIGHLAACAIYETETNSCDIYRLPFNTKLMVDRYPTLISEAVVKCFSRLESRDLVGKIV